MLAIILPLLSLLDLALTAQAIDLGAQHQSTTKQVSVRNLHRSTIAVRVFDSISPGLYAQNTALDVRNIAVGDEEVFEVPNSWSGMVPVIDASRSWDGQESGIEPTFDAVRGLTVDVSYLAGYTLPIVCGCEEGGAERMVVGCNTDLLKTSGGVCPAGTENSSGGCRNPLRGDMNAQEPTDFFKPCGDSVYSYEQAHQVQNGGDCRYTDTLVCCVGADCSPSERQGPWAPRTHSY